LTKNDTNLTEILRRLQGGATDLDVEIKRRGSEGPRLHNDERLEILYTLTLVCGAGRMLPHPALTYHIKEQTEGLALKRKTRMEKTNGPGTD